MKRSISEVANAIGVELKADCSLVVSGVASVHSASAEDLVFVEDPKFLEAALASHAGAVITAKFAESASHGKPLLIAEHPKLAFARAARFLADESEKGSVAATASVDATAHIGTGVAIAERAVIGRNASVGNATRIGAGAVVGKSVVIGRDCHIYSHVTIYSGTTIGDRVTIHAGAVLGSDGFGYVRDRKTGHYEKFPQVGTLIIEDDVEIGANTTIDRGALDQTRIGRGTKIDNLVHIGHNCQIGEDVVIAAQTGLSGSITIENGVVLGGQVGIGEHARVCEGVMVGGQGGILPNKILRGKGVAFWGTPAQPLRQYLKQLAALARLSKK